MLPSSAPAVLGLLAKWPHPGTVKTRLDRSPEQAAAVARAFLLDSLDRLGQLPVRRVLVYSPPNAGPDFASLVKGRFELQPQVSGDLGVRMAAFFTAQIEAGSRATVLVGTDSPTLPVAHIEQAFRELEQADLVLGPASDGGYYLIGCGRRLPPIFEGIAWSTFSVLAQTVARLPDSSWKLALLPPWYDVDTPEDWAMLAGHLAALRRAGLDPGVPHTEALLQADSA